MVKVSLKICIFCSSLLLLIVEHVFAHNKEALDVNATRRLKRQLSGNDKFDRRVAQLRASAANPNVRDYNYYGLRAYNDNDFPFEQVILQTVNNRYDKVITIPKYIKATIKKSHLGKNRGSDAIPTQIRNYLHDVGQYHGEQPNHPLPDQAGHLLAHSLGGTNDEFNFVPMSAVVNTQTIGLHSIWFGEEVAMRNFLNASPNRRIEWELIVKHGSINTNGVYSLRPTSFFLRHKNYNEHGNVVDNYNVATNQLPTVMCFNNKLVDDGCTYWELD